MKTLIHIIPTLGNGGAETVLSRLIEEFSKDGVKQIVISIQGNLNDFNHTQIARYCAVIHAKEDFHLVKKAFKANPEATVLAWMYKGILKAHHGPINAPMNSLGMTRVTIFGACGFTSSAGVATVSVILSRICKRPARACFKAFTRIS